MSSASTNTAGTNTAGTSTPGALTPVLQMVGDEDAVACDPEGDACAVPRVAHP